MKQRNLLLLLLCWLALAFPAAASAPPGRYTVNAGGNVLDTRTGLTWQQAVDAGLYTQADAIIYCASLPLAGGGWRLPKVSELLTLVDPTRFDPSIDAAAFPDTPAEAFWSSSAHVGSTSGEKWLVYFGPGAADRYDASSMRRVRCVR